ncbi:DUF2059 domain-containing protein [Polycladidibacter stylochi]|uniref:DUF2059 domain-containing protein n=1 Tax=Polycladidibacter stylochi TaxID=1807766 RepID=UPI0008324BEA|nr:DUF2059 domain-containing protein [Pseudovibrio stylochi]
MLAPFKSKIISAITATLIVGSVSLSSAFAAQETFKISHLEAAKKVVIAMHTTDGFDNILPDIAERTRTLFIRSNPALSDDIDRIVNEVAMSMVARRPLLDRVIYEVWARRFSEDELNQIATFYNTEAGKKLAIVNGQIAALSIGAAKQWSDALSTDMVTEVRKKLKEVANK